MDRWEVFLRKFAERVSVANEGHLTVRCWKSSTLKREITSITESSRDLLRRTFPPAHVIIDQLKRMGWVHSLTMQQSAGAESDEFLFVGLESFGDEPISPLELLQAYLPDGVVCYFSAIGYYELTTQLVAHHHIARRIKPNVGQDVRVATPTKPGRSVTKRNPLGTEIFRIGAVGCHLNRRDVSLVPGIQLRVVSPRCWLRITTLEQTLLDALMQPTRCGGESIALEAWETGVRRMDPDRMAKHLLMIQREELDRRVGAVLELMGADFSRSDLGRHLLAVQNRLRTIEVVPIPLLTGLEFPETNPVWKVRIP